MPVDMSARCRFAKEDLDNWLAGQRRESYMKGGSG